MRTPVEIVKSKIDDLHAETALNAEGILPQPVDSAQAADDSLKPIEAEESSGVLKLVEQHSTASAASPVDVTRGTQEKTKSTSTKPKKSEPPMYPYPENWTQGVPEMNDAIKVTNLIEERSIESRSKKQEGAMLQLPTGEKNVNESLAEVKVDCVAEKVSTVIAPACTNSGEIKSTEGVMVQGTQLGNITIDLDGVPTEGTVVVTKNGVVRGHIEGKRIVVLGRVEGSIRSHSHLTLGDTAVVTGDVEYRTIRMMDGSEIDGKCVKMREEA